MTLDLRIARSNRRVHVFGLAVTVALLRGSLARAADPAKVVGADKCAECHNHKAEAQAWQATTHAKRFRTEPMHQLDAAKEIAKKLGIRRIRRSDRCTTCHYTTQAGRGGRVRAISGVSCESCHGGAREWIKIHNDFGEGVNDPVNETAAHRTQRLAACDAAGMNRKSEIHAIAANCFGCHTVPDEELINVGGHTPGSAFELVAWMSGEIRHNFSAGPKNAASPKGTSPAKHRRVLYVVGRGVDLEYSLRSLAKATKPGTFADSMKARVEAALGELKKIEGAAATDEAKKMIAAIDASALKPGNGEVLTKTADAVGAAVRAFVEKHDGTQLAGLDALLPKPDQYKGKALAEVAP